MNVQYMKVTYELEHSESHELTDIVHTHALTPKNNFETLEKLRHSWRDTETGLVSTQDHFFNRPLGRSLRWFDHSALSFRSGPLR